MEENHWDKMVQYLTGCLDHLIESGEQDIHKMITICTYIDYIKTHIEIDGIFELEKGKYIL